MMKEKKNYRYLFAEGQEKHIQRGALCISPDLNGAIKWSIKTICCKVQNFF